MNPAVAVLPELSVAVHDGRRPRRNVDLEAACKDRPEPSTQTVAVGAKLNVAPKAVGRRDVHDRRHA